MFKKKLEDPRLRVLEHDLPALTSKAIAGHMKSKKAGKLKPDGQKNPDPSGAAENAPAEAESETPGEEAAEVGDGDDQAQRVFRPMPSESQDKARLARILAAKHGDHGGNHAQRVPGLRPTVIKK